MGNTSSLIIYFEGMLVGFALKFAWKLLGETNILPFLKLETKTTWTPSQDGSGNERDLLGME